MPDKSAVGTSLGETRFPVERGKIREFAGAILDDNPAYEDEDAPAPPTFTMTVAFWPREGGGAIPNLFEDMRRVLHAEQEYEYLKPVQAGDQLVARSKISDVYEKEGKRGGKMNFVVFETRFTNQRGEDVVIARQVIVETAKAAT